MRSSTGTKSSPGTNSSEANYFQIGRRLMLIFAVLIALILGGNGLVVWQFYIARSRTNRLTGANQQMILVLQLQVSLLSFHQRLEDLARSRDAQRMVVETGPLLSALDEQTQRTRAALLSLPTEAPADPAFWPTLEAIQATLPAQQKAITELVRSSDWEAVQLRLGSALKPIETQTAILVQSIGKQAGEELSDAVAEMQTIQRTILIIVPATAVCTFCIAAFFGWSIARRIIELRLEERVTERMRIAGELHDTLIQTIHASQFLAGTALMKPDDPMGQQRALETLSIWLQQAVQEGRAALNSLHQSTTERNDLAEAFERAINDSRGRGDAEVSLSVAGRVKEMHPVVREEIYRIGYEAIRNACSHASASRVEVELRYAQDLDLRIRDNGVGIDPSVIERGKAGHFGLQGMRERAVRIGGKLTLASNPASGTEIKLVVPGGIVFKTIRPERAGALTKVRKLLARVDFKI
jgi:signal transduction histidine kinase